MKTSMQLFRPFPSLLQPTLNEASQGHGIQYLRRFMSPTGEDVLFICCELKEV
jgi:hypothetical protein